MPGDANAKAPILHEASDDGKIAGRNAVLDITEYERKVPLSITFCDPNIANVGMDYKELKSNKVDFITGKVTFEGQGKSIVKLKEQGLLHIYVLKKERSDSGS